MTILSRVALVKNRIPRTTGTNKYGLNPDVDSGPESIWPPGGLIQYPTVAAIPSIVSSDANDAAAGTGAQQILVMGLDADWRPVEQLIELDGVTPVLLDVPYMRINRIFVMRAGSVQTSVGEIVATIGAVEVVHMRAGSSSTEKAAFTIGAKQLGYILGCSGSIRRAGATGSVQATYDLKIVTGIDGANPVCFTGAEMAMAIDGASAHEHNFEIPFLITGPADVELRVVDVSDSNTICTGFISYLTEDLEPAT